MRFFEDNRLNDPERIKMDRGTPSDDDTVTPHKLPRRQRVRPIWRQCVRPIWQQCVRPIWRLCVRTILQHPKWAISIVIVVGLGLVAGGIYYIIVNATKPQTTESGTFPTYLKAENPNSYNYFPSKKWYEVNPNGKSVYEDILNRRDAEIYYPPINVTRYLISSIHGKDTSCFLVFKWKMENKGKEFSLCCPTYHPNTTCNFVLRLRFELDLQLPLENDPGNKLLFHQIYEVRAAYQPGECKKCRTFPNSQTDNMETSGKDVKFSISVENAP